MAANKKRAFDGLYAQLEEVNNHVTRVRDKDCVEN